MEGALLQPYMEVARGETVVVLNVCSCVTSRSFATSAASMNFRQKILLLAGQLSLIFAGGGAAFQGETLGFVRR